MYLVPPDYLNTVTNKNSITSPPPDKVRKAPKAEKKYTSSKRRRSAKKIKTKKKKDTPQREHDRWVAQRSATRRDFDNYVKVRAKLHEADVERKRQIKTVADFLKEVLPSAATSSPPTQLKASHSGTETEQNIKSEFSAKRRRLAYKTTTPIPSTIRDVIYETPTSHTPLSIKRDGDDDDVSTDDQQM